VAVRQGDEAAGGGNGNATVTRCSCFACLLFWTLFQQIDWLPPCSANYSSYPHQMYFVMMHSGGSDILRSFVWFINHQPAVLSFLGQPSKS
jgi:hypothetical protein